ncbi:hypothetical protein ACR9ML_01360 [Helicobacter pylori]
MKKIKDNFTVLDGVYYDRYGNKLHGAAEQLCRAKHEYGGIKPALDQNEQLKEAFYYSFSLNREQDKKIQCLENILGSILPTLNFDIPSLDSNTK